MVTDKQNTLSLALECLAQEIVKAMPARERPDELESALAMAFHALGNYAIQEKESRHGDI